MVKHTKLHARPPSCGRGRAACCAAHLAAGATASPASSSARCVNTCSGRPRPRGSAPAGAADEGPAAAAACCSAAAAAAAAAVLVGCRAGAGRAGGGAALGAAAEFAARSVFPSAPPGEQCRRACWLRRERWRPAAGPARAGCRQGAAQGGQHRRGDVRRRCDAAVAAPRASPLTSSSLLPLGRLASLTGHPRSTGFLLNTSWHSAGSSAGRILLQASWSTALSGVMGVGLATWRCSAAGAGDGCHG
jgi:hypothetical protein